jgi:hypothetical protein
VRKIPAALVILGLATVGLAGCSLPGQSDCSPTASDAELLELVEVGDDGDVDFYTPFKAEESSFATLEQGEGDAVITTDAQIVGLDITMVSGETGEELPDLVEGGAYLGGLSPLTQVLPSWSEALECASAGSRVVIAMAPEDIDPEIASALGLAPDESAVAVVGVDQVFLAAADGAYQFNTGTGLPSVVRAPDGRPGLVMPETAAPDELVVQTLKKGDGAVVGADAAVVAHVLSVPWDDQAQLTSTWDTQPELIQMGEDPALTEALEGQTVGSQVLVVVPASDDAAGSATVKVIDILGILPAS